MCHLGSAFCVRYDLSKKTGGATSKYSQSTKKIRESAFKNKNFIYICMSINCPNSKIFILGIKLKVLLYFIRALYLTDELRKA